MNSESWLGGHKGAQKHTLACAAFAEICKPTHTRQRPSFVDTYNFAPLYFAGHEKILIREQVQYDL